MATPNTLTQIRELDPKTDHQRIVFLCTCYEFPFDTTRSLEFALFRTFAVPSISALLDQTAEFKVRPQKRYDDTDLIVSELMEWGYDSERGKNAIHRMNQIHGRFEISNEDFLYVLSTFIFEPIRWNQRFGWRTMCEQERLGTFYFWCEVGQRMSIQNIPEDYETFERFNVEYERKHFRFTEANRRIGTATRELFVGWAPWIVRPVARWAIHAMLDEPLIEAFGFPRPSRFARALVSSLLSLRGTISGWLPARRTPRLRTKMKHTTYPSGYRVEELGPPDPGKSLETTSQGIDPSTVLQSPTENIMLPKSSTKTDLFTRIFLIVTAVVLLVAIVWTTFFDTEDDPTPVPLPEPVVRAWKEAGARYVWRRTGPSGDARLVVDSVHQPGDLPTFEFRTCNPEKLKSLPVPKTPFGLSIRSELKHTGVAALDRFESLHFLSLVFPNVKELDLKPLAALQNLRYLSLYRRWVTDEVLKDVSRFGKLEALHLHSCPVTDAGLKHLRSLHNLRVLTLHGTDVSDAGLKHLSKHRELRYLDLDYTNVTDVGLKQLAPLTQLNYLGLPRDQRTDEALRTLRAIGLLHAYVGARAKNGTRPTSPEEVCELNLSSTSVTDEGLRELEPLENLNMLRLRSKNITDETLRTLRKLGLLHTIDNAFAEDGKRPNCPEDVVSLEIGDTQVTDEGLRELAQFKNLRSLDLHHTRMTEAGLKHLAPFHQLSWLCLPPAQTTDDALRTLKDLGLLHTCFTDSSEAKVRQFGPEDVKSIFLSFRPVTDEGLKLLTHFKNVRSLSLSGKGITDLGLKELTSFPQLQKLDLNYTAVTSDGLQQLSALTSLTSLNLSNTDVTDERLDALANLTQLQSLDLSKTQVSDKGVKHLMNLKSLTSLKVYRSRVTKIGLDRLRAALPNCTITPPASE